MLTLYYAPKTVSLASHIALLEAGIEFDLQLISFASNEQQGSAYVKINPKARVPVMVTKSGSITETPAMLAYIAQCAPNSVIGLPASPFEFAQIQSFNSYLCSTVHVAHAHRMRGYRWTDDENAMTAMQNYAHKSMGDAFKLMENEMIKGPWVRGQQYSICDPYLFTITRWLEADGVDVQKFAKIRAHEQRMYERDAVSLALEQQGPDA